jgi:biopolymer transport protein ExbD
MRFKGGSRDEPEINLIPFIDVLLVVLIFLMLSTTYSKFTEMQLKLPVADTEAQRDYPKEIVVAVGADGNYAVNRAAQSSRAVEDLALALANAAKAVKANAGGKEAVVVISADASARHQAVITVMEAARRAGLSQITFATQSSSAGARK